MGTLLILFLAFVVAFTPTSTIAGPAPGAHTVDSVNDLPVPSSQFRDRSHENPYGEIIIIVFLICCAIGPIMAVLIRFCPQIFPCQNIKNRKPGCGSCDWAWADMMTRYGYYRNRLRRAPIVVQVNMPAHTHGQVHAPPQYAGQNVPLMPPTVVIQEPSPIGGRYQPGLVYAVPSAQGSVYTSPSYPTNPTT